MRPGRAVPLLLLGAACASLPGRPAPLARAEFVIEGVRVFDGERVQERTTVIVDGGTIVAVGPRVEVAEASVRIDGRGKTLLPGFIDAHVHVHDAAHLEQALAFGVTTVLDMLSEPRIAAALRKVAPSPGFADFSSAGNAVTAPRGHGTQFGPHIRTLERAEDADAFVQACVDEGSDYIKVIYTPDSPRFESISKDTLTRAIAAAHVRDRLVVVHVTTKAAAREAIAAGADGLAHVFFDAPIDADLTALARARGIFVVPTLAVVSSGTGAVTDLLADERISGFLPPTSAQHLERKMPWRLEGEYRYASDAVAKLANAGVPILVGSDAPNPGTTYGATVHDELVRLVDAGMTPTEALASATSVPARAFGLDDRGRIAVGRRADLLLVVGDPTRDIRATRAIEAIWKRGRAFDREAYRSRIAPSKALGDGLVSDFNDGRSTVSFGLGWGPSTDRIRGGQSTVELEVVEGGADGGAGALLLSGTVGPGPYAWAGATFTPGEQRMQAVDLSDRATLEFWTKGKAGNYVVMLFTVSGGFRPAVRTFRVEASWSAQVIELDAFNTARADVIGIFIGSTTQGALQLYIDEVRLRKIAQP